MLGSAETTSSQSDLRRVYEALLESPETPLEAAYVVPGSAKESPLIQRLLGREDDRESPSGSAHKGLSRRDLVLLIEWVDLGAEWELARSEAGGTP